jgi:MFS family permease
MAVSETPERGPLARLRRIRARAAGDETGMIRMFDLHALAAAGDALIAVGLAGTIFFAVPLGEARAKVALYLLVTMVPFAVLAPLIGPLLDRFRHGRRYALATTMLGRAFLAFLIAEYLDRPALYPAAFAVLALSRAYGVARAAAVPRLLPERLTLSQANARGSVYGTVAGIVVLPLGLAAFWFGPQWPLRVASLIFVVGMVVALRLPPRADSEPPESLPRLFRLALPRLRRGGEQALQGRLVIASLLGSASHRALYGFLLLFLAFAVRAGDVPTDLWGLRLGEGPALGLVSGALVTGTFLAVAAGSRLRIRRPMLFQGGGLVLIAGTAVLATVRLSLPLVALVCLIAAISSGLAKLALDSAIQERIDERLRATAFARSETLLMLAFVGGGAVGLIPMPGRVGVGLAAALMVVAAGWAVGVGVAGRKDRLSGRPTTADHTQEPATEPTDPPPAAAGDGEPATRRGLGQLTPEPATATRAEPLPES